MSSHRNFAFAFACLGIALVAIFVYWPGLLGGYIFDDYQFIVENTDVQVSTLNFGDWVRAAMSFPAGQQGRWLTMLSFAANTYFTGIDPFWIKLTNLAIHLINALLLFLALQTLFNIWELRFPSWRSSPPQRQYAALFVSAAWLLLPINLTGVLYAAQRLESFSNLFVLLGLVWYLRARLRLQETGNGWGEMAASLAICTGVGLLAKESAALLPSYALCVEFALGSLSEPKLRRGVVALYATIIGIPLLIGVLWLASWIGTAAAPARPFTTLQRLLTESRVLVDYIAWTLLPTSHALNLYHDDISISQNLLSPSTTLLSIVGLLSLLSFALWQRNKRPLFCLGVLWFFAGHTLTATIIPLDLIYEHRNYFSSIGLLLALASLFGLEPIVQIQQRLVITLAVSLIAFYAFTTSLRAREWSHPVSLALSEADKRPDSPRAQYELGRTLSIAAHYTPSPMLDRARKAFADCMTLPRSGILCEQGLIIVSANTKQPIDEQWWESIVTKLQKESATEGDSTALTALLDCQRSGICPRQPQQLGQALQAALSHSHPNVRILMVYADYAALMLNDYTLAERMMREAVALKPRQPAVRANLVALLASEGRKEDAKREFLVLSKLNYFGSIDDMLVTLRKQIDSIPSS